jgi:hypothetical protein
MAAPFNRLRSKLNRAICAYLIKEGCGTAADTAPENSQQIKSYPNTTVRAGIATPNPALTGNRDIPVHIGIRGSAVRDPANLTDVTTARKAFDDRLASVYDALMQGDGATLRATAAAITAAGRALAISAPGTNADMADFTCQAWYDGGEGDAEPDQEGTRWEEILIFRAFCAPSNVD